ncbi:MAG: helix-turn-helix domain-containing protein, partial [Bacteroidetes bacterium]|nr:helix-turn-helix domain-containing protein [Bacteroidota bacterium]
DFKSDTLELVHPEKTIRMTQKEAELIHYFHTFQNRILKRDEILNTIWGDDDYFKGRSLDVFISRLRKYLSLDKKIVIENIHSIGFQMKFKEE